MRDYALAALRVVAAFLFCCHGAQKLFGAFGGMGHGAAAKTFTLLWFAGVLEFVGGLLIGVGLFTRIVAFILCGEMAVAYFKQHLPRGFFPIQNGGELAVLYCFLFLYFCAAGAGAFSVDAMRGRR